MSKIKKISILLVALILVFPLGASADGFNLTDVSGMGLPAGSIYGIIQNLVFWILGMFAFFGIIGFTISGIMYLISAGNDEMITKAKNYMQYSIIGVIVGLSGLVIIQAVYWMLEGYNAAF